MSDKSESIFRLANAYARDLANSERSAVSGEPEAQLTVPVSNLLSGLVSVSDLGRLDLIRETRLDRTRPDFAAMHTASGRTHQKGYVELKAPGVTVDVSKWKGRNATQWERMKDEAEIVIVCNGAEAQLYHHGVAKGRPSIFRLRIRSNGIPRRLWECWAASSNSAHCLSSR